MEATQLNRICVLCSLVHGQAELNTERMNNKCDLINYFIDGTIP